MRGRVRSGTVEGVVAVPAPPQQPMQRPALALDELLQAGVAYGIAPVEQHQRVAPHVGAQEGHVLPDGL